VARWYHPDMGPGTGAFVISLDFELYWGVRDVLPLEAYRSNLEGVHVAVPRLLDLFGAHDVHATWATVGLVFARNREEARHHAPQLRPTYVRPELSPYADLDKDLDANAKCYFAPHLIREIAARPHQEIATHTYSHFYCTEPGQSAEQFEADLVAAMKIAEPFGVRPTSLVFPRNQCNARYLPVLRRQSIGSYRGVPDHWALHRGASRVSVTTRRGVRLADNYARLLPDMSLPTSQLRGDPLNIPGTRYQRPFTPRLRRLDRFRQRRVRGEMTRAAQNGEIYHLWWHPHDFGRHTDENLAFLEGLLRHARRLREEHGFRSLNMAEITQEHGSS
jgi:peptidoglycan/xylan/chitin deacetylase (PgdA/CDA1 family)